MLRTWWALLVPALGSVWAITMLDRPGVVENSAQSAGEFLLLVFVLPAAGLIAAGVVLGKILFRAPGREETAPGYPSPSKTD
jgi:hypothetical protein